MLSEISPHKNRKNGGCINRNKQKEGEKTSNKERERKKGETKGAVIEASTDFQPAKECMYVCMQHPRSKMANRRKKGKKSKKKQKRSNQTLYVKETDKKRWTATTNTPQMLISLLP